MFPLCKWVVWSLLGAIFAPLPAWSQNPDAKAVKTSTASEANGRYAAEALVVEHLDTDYRYAADGTGSRQITMTALLQTDAAVKQFSVVTIGFAGSSEHVVFDYVRVRKPDGSVVETPLTDALEMPQAVTQQAPFYSDLKAMQIPVRNLAVGDRLEYRVREITTKAEVPDEFWGEHRLTEGVIVLNETVELRVPKSKDVIVWIPTIKPVVTEDGNDRVYQWTHSATDLTVGKEAEAKKDADKKRVLSEAEQLDRTEGKFPQIAWTTFKSWADVGAWYRGLAAPRAVPDDDVKAKTAELIAGKTTEEDKIRALYSYVSTQIRYIGVDFGIGRYQPHMAGDVLRNQYGDCKDKHTLLAAMLDAAGVKADAVLIGANIRFNPAVPSPAAFNHVITMVPMSTGPVWLDATQEGAPYRVLLQLLRDKQALVVPPEGVAELETTPASLPFKPFETFEIKGSLDANGKETVHMVLSERGDAEVFVRAVLREISPGQYDEFIQKFSQGMGFGGTTSHAEISRPDATADPLRIAYDYTRDKPGDDWGNYRIMPPMPPVYLPSVDENNPPQVPIDLGSPGIASVTTELKLPDGWSATLPDAVHVHTSFATFDKTYRFEKGMLCTDRRIEVLERKIPASQWKEYEKFYEDVGLKTGEPYVQLRAAMKAGDSGLPLHATNNDQAEDLVDQANKAAMAWDLDGAMKLLDQAKGLNDNQPYLWSVYGYVAAMRGTNLEAVSYFKKEIALHPDEQRVYPLLARSQIATQDLAGAKQSLQTGLALGPDAQMSLMLASLLHLDGEYAEETKVLEPVVVQQPGNEQVKLMLGTADMRSGRLDDGAKILEALLKSTDNPAILNDSSYELADKNMDLDLAETSMSKALNKIESDSASLTLAANPNTARAKAIALASAWDTMGWVYFREHKFEQARVYIEAAWLNKPSPTVGLHLGELEEAEKNFSQALATYDMTRTLVVNHWVNGLDVSQTDDGKELERRINALRRRGAVDRYPGPAITRLQNLRHLKIGPSEGRFGTADYKVLLAGGRVEEVKAPDSSSVSDADEMVKRLVMQNWWPKGSEAKMVREGVLNCHSGVCEFVIVPLQ